MIKTLDHLIVAVSDINEAEKKISNDAISDKEKYLLSYKIETLKNIKQ